MTTTESIVSELKRLDQLLQGIIISITDFDRSSNNEIISFDDDDNDGKDIYHHRHEQQQEQEQQQQQQQQQEQEHEAGDRHAGHAVRGTWGYRAPRGLRQRAAGSGGRDALQPA